MSNKESIVLVGGGGHCKSVIDVIEQENKYIIVGIIDQQEKIGQKVLGYPIIGCDDDLEKLSKQYNNFVITVGQIKSAKVRIKLYNKIKSLDGYLPTIISPISYISKHTIIGEGNVIMHNVIINANVNIGVNNIINSSSLIEHDTIIGNHNHISTKAVVNGTCEINNEVFIGSGAILHNNITIKSNTIIPAARPVRRSVV